MMDHCSLLVLAIAGVIAAGTASGDISESEITALNSRLCSRVFIKGLDGGKVAHLQLLGVYVAQNVSWSELPVYKHEQENLYLYISMERHSLQLGKQDATSTAIVHADLKSFNISRALAQSDNHPYYDMVNYWHIYEPVQKTYLPLPASELKLVCVSEDFVLCKSKQLTFTGDIPFPLRNIRVSDDVPGTWISDVTDIKFYMLDGSFKNMRPVYEVLGFYNVLYLFYNEQAWEISDDWLGPNVRRNVVFRVVDSALRPEYITSEWQLSQNGTLTFYHLPSLRLRCSGQKAAPEGACTVNYPCQNAALCKYVARTATSGEILCMCGPDHVGPTCAVEAATCKPQRDLDMPDNALFYSANGYQLGDVMTYFCSEESENTFFLSKCESKKAVNGTMPTEWVHQGNCNITAAASAHKVPLPVLSLLLLVAVCVLHS